MTWVRLDDQHDLHRKVARLSDLAYRIWVSGMAWCHRQRTLGVIPTGDESLIVPGRKPKELAKAVVELVAAGLWHSTEAGYTYHDWQSYQTTPGATAQERGRLGAAKRWGDSKERLATLAEPIAKPVSYDGQASSKGLANDAPIPIPIPTPPAIAVGGERAAAAAAPRPDPEPDPDRALPISLKFEPHPSSVSEIAAHYGVSEPEVLEEVPEFISYWAIGKGKGTKKSAGSWQAKFRDRCRDVFEGRAPKAKRGNLAVVTSPPEPRLPTGEELLAELDRQNAPKPRKAGGE